MALSAGNSIFILCDTLNSYQPLSYFQYNSYSNDYVKTPEDIPENYIHWLHLYNDVYGDCVDVLYPKSPSTGEDIVILYRGFYQHENEWRKIYWTHGDNFLFKYQIIPLLEEEWTYKADIPEDENISIV